MSVWTHVAGVIRVDSIRVFMPDPKFDKIFVKSLWGDTNISNMPTGSEGSLDYRIIENPDEDSMSAYTVVIFGDLRDYGANRIEDIKDWWEHVLSEFEIVRQAVLQICPEDGEPVILKKDYDI